VLKYKRRDYMLSLSLLSIKNKPELIKKMYSLNPDYIHLDVADGIFVPSKAEFLDLPEGNQKLDVHLMVEDVEWYLEVYSALDPEYITFHIEVTTRPDVIIDKIKRKNIKVGLAISPETTVEEIKPYLGLVDLVLVMGVTPGFGGQSFLSDSLTKVDELYSLRETNGYNYLIEIDGGINKETLKECSKCDMFVVGSYITLSEEYKERAQIFIDTKKGI